MSRGLLTNKTYLIRRQLVLTSTNRVRIIGARTLNPDVHVVGRAADAETVEDDELLQVRRVPYLALLEGTAGLDGDAEGIVEGTVAACH